MKRSLLSALLLCALGISASAQAAFVGSYAVGNWTTTNSGGGGALSLAGAPASISLTSADDQSFAFNSVDFTIAAAATGTISFDWSYSTLDDAPFFDPFGYLLNGAFFQLTADFGASNQGSPPGVSIPVSVGDIFGFSMRTGDSCCGPATATITNFVGPEPAAVPEPASLALLAIGLAGLGAMRQRKAAI